MVGIILVKWLLLARVIRKAFQGAVIFMLKCAGWGIWLDREEWEQPPSRAHRDRQRFRKAHGCFQSSEYANMIRKKAFLALHSLKSVKKYKWIPAIIKIFFVYYLIVGKGPYITLFYLNTVGGHLLWALSGEAKKKKIAFWFFFWKL